MKSTFAPFTIDDLELSPHRIDIWQVSLHNALPSDQDLLNQEEQTRASRFHFAHHQRRFTIARSRLREILAHYLSILPTEIDFLENHFGKPYIKHAKNIEFNLSHSKDMALLAVGCQHALGIDLEFFAPRPYLGIAEQMFSPTEKTTLLSIPQALQPLGFYNVWAQKESLIKACGMGLSYPTETFDVPVLPSTTASIVDSINQKSWKVSPFMPKINCCAALCHHLEVDEIRYLILDETLIIR